MTQGSNQPALQEIRHNIAHQDFIKARLVVADFPDMAREEQKAILLELAGAESAFAIPVLSYLLHRHDQLRADFPEIAESILAKAVQSPNIVIEGLAGVDPERACYLKIAGKLNMQEAVPNIVQLLLLLEDKADQLTALSSLGTLCNPDAIDAITEFLYLDDIDLAAAAVTALGHIGTPTAIQPLAVLLGKNVNVDQLILDLFAEIQDEFCLQKLNEALQSHSAPIRNHARTWLIAIGEKVVPILVANLSGRDPDHQILSLNVLQEIRDESAALGIRTLISNQPANPNVRFAAFEALADLSSRKGDYILAGGVTDPDSNVRLAAAKAIDRNLDATLAAGIRNMVDEPGEESQNIIKAVIGAQAGKLFLELVSSRNFQESAKRYLGKDVHSDVRDYFVNLLQKSDVGEFASAIIALGQQQNKQVKGRVCAVDDSKMVLSVYRSVMTELGFEVILFSEPKKAIDWLQTEKPDFLCTDLNMPEITGIELIQEVRKKYTKDELPIVMVTTQNEVQDNRAAEDAGVSEIIYKPFDAGMITTVFGKITGN